MVKLDYSACMSSAWKLASIIRELVLIRYQLIRVVILVFDTYKNVYLLRKQWKHNLFHSVALLRALFGITS